ncbi:uncharacterized protein LOC141640997 [Silene latifolia]|uniref:uncharacterized protein LOC141640997 n=1 Tax=Silene latifolia TaxID=37657 RepID=UPI003D76C701
MVLRIHSWGAKQLSYAGRLTLVKTVLSQLHCYWARIYLIPKGVIHKVDSICRNYLWSGKVWLLSRYSTQKTYHYLVAIRDKISWVPLVWNRVCLLKVNFITWLYARNRLLTKIRLLNVRVVSDGVCCICAATQESHDHIYFDCHFRSHFLELVKQWLEVSWSFHSLDNILRRRFKSLLQKQILMANFACLVYLIWMSRNTAKHDSSVPRPAKILQQLQHMIKFRLQVIGSEVSILRSRNWLIARGLIAC